MIVLSCVAVYSIRCPLCFGYTYARQKCITEANRAQNVVQIVATRYHLGRQAFIELAQPACLVVLQLLPNRGRNRGWVDGAKKGGQVIERNAVVDVVKI